MHISGWRRWRYQWVQGRVIVIDRMIGLRQSGATDATNHFRCGFRRFCFDGTLNKTMRQSRGRKARRWFWKRQTKQAKMWSWTHETPAYATKRKSIRVHDSFGSEARPRRRARQRESRRKKESEDEQEDRVDKVDKTSKQLKCRCKRLTSCTHTHKTSKTTKSRHKWRASDYESCETWGQRLEGITSIFGSIGRCIGYSSGSIGGFDWPFDQSPTSSSVAHNRTSSNPTTTRTLHNVVFGMLKKWSGPVSKCRFFSVSRCSNPNRFRLIDFLTAAIKTDFGTWLSWRTFCQSSVRVCFLTYNLRSIHSSSLLTKTSAN